MFAGHLKNLFTNKYFPVFIILLFGITYSVFGLFHKMGNFDVETDFYGLYAHDVQRLLDGDMVEERDHAPGYAVMVAGLTLITGDVFAGGKALSVISAIGLIWVFYKLADLLFDRYLALMSLAVISVMTIPFSFVVGLDIVFTFFFVASIYLYYKDEGQNGKWLVLSGIVSGITYLIRYNGILLPMGVVAIVLFLNPNDLDLKGKIRHLAYYGGSMVLIILPWLIFLAFFDAGGVSSPGLNVAIAWEFYGQGGEFTGDERALVDPRFDSLMTIVFYDIQHFVTHYMKNIADRFEHFSLSAFPFPGFYFLVTGLLLFMTSANRRQVSLFVFPVLGFLVLCLVNYITRYYLFIIPFFVVFVAFFFRYQYPANRYFSWFSMNYVKWPVFALLLVFMLRGSVNRAQFEIKSEPRHLISLADRLYSEDGSVKVMARKPHLAFLANMKFENIPMVGSVDEMMESVNKLNCKYVYYGSQERKYRPELAQLMNPESVANYLVPIYQDVNRGIYLYQTK